MALLFVLAPADTKRDHRIVGELFNYLHFRDESRELYSFLFAVA